jgi:hypothetical protein
MNALIDVWVAMLQPGGLFIWSYLYLYVFVLMRYFVERQWRESRRPALA